MLTWFRTCVLLAAAVFTSTAVAPDRVGAEVVVKKKKKRKKKRAKDKPGFKLGTWTGRLASNIETGAGVLGGYQSLRGSAAFERVAVSARGEIERHQWRLRMPVHASHRQTQGTSLSETQGRTSLELRYRKNPRLRATADIGVAAVWRPDWPDLYQPLPGGGYATTDRRSHWDRTIEFGLAGIPLRHHHARVKYEYRLVDYREDSNFDPLDAPTHLVPGDHEKHSIDLSWRYLGRGWKAGLSADIFFKNSFFAFSRDAGTGSTHAGAGGPPPNPLQETRGIEPAISAEREFAGGAFEIEVGYGYEIVQDTFEGYYSYAGHHPEAALTWKLDRQKTLTGKAELFWRTYGPNSYAEGANHPPLAYGDRRVDRKAKAGLDFAWKLGKHWTATAGADLIVRRTNFPRYEPGIFPASRQYDIDWNYNNWFVIAGIEYIY